MPTPLITFLLSLDCFAGAAALLGVLGLTLGYLLYAGPGIWANNNAVVWALDIASYDWWIGVASGSLLVSAVLLLLVVRLHYLIGTCQVRAPMPAAVAAV